MPRLLNAWISPVGLFESSSFRGNVWIRASELAKFWGMDPIRLEDLLDFCEIGYPLDQNRKLTYRDMVWLHYWLGVSGIWHSCSWSRIIHYDVVNTLLLNVHAWQEWPSEDYLARLIEDYVEHNDLEGVKYDSTILASASLNAFQLAWQAWGLLAGRAVSLGAHPAETRVLG